MKIFVHYWLPLFAWCGIIFYFSSIPHLETNFGFGDFFLRKCAHVAEYAVLFLLARRAAGNSLPSRSFWQINGMALLFTVLYAASDEYHQSFVPTRGPSVYDVMIDTFGAGIGLCGYWWRSRRKEAA